MKKAGVRAVYATLMVEVLTSLASLVGLAACSSASPPELVADGPPDGAPDGSPDGAPDAPPDGEPDARPDGGPDGPPPSNIMSCRDLAPTCGPRGNDDCCASPSIAGGTFYRSYDQADDELSGDKSAPASVGATRIDKYEITVGRFRAFIAAGLGIRAAAPIIGAGAHPALADSGWMGAWTSSLLHDRTALQAAVKCDATFATWTDEPAGNESRPMNCITWYEAMAFCIWDGGYLPTEAEWNHAASGGEEQRAFPWSSPSSSLEITPTHASYYDGADCVGDGQPGCAVTDLVPVGSRGAGEGRWGQSDLSGNVWEWMLDWHDDEYETPCTDCARLFSGVFRVLRGGGFRGGPELVRSGGRNSFPPAWRLYSVGARCARPVER